MKGTSLFIIASSLLLMASCSIFNDRPNAEIPDFDFPQSVVFEPSLSNYNIYEGIASDLIPSADFHLLELTSILFTDYSQKQRLVKIPEGTEMIRQNDGTIDFPNGTILVKTFFYYADERDTSLGKRIIESRLEIKEDNIWNVATYLWNQGQTDATLELTGHDTEVSWINANGNTISTLYHVPDENECIACHQANSEIIPLGSTLRNLNRMVDRDGESLNQINHFQSLGLMNNFQLSQVSQIADYNNLNFSLSDRARAYLDMNCAHCHNPNAWETAAEENLDLRYETALEESRILNEDRRITDTVLEGEMPFIGTTILDQEGVNLIVEYIESL